MKAAAVAAQRGHEVTLYEASAQLGGQVLLAQLLPRRSEFGGASTNLQREMELAGVAWCATPGSIAPWSNGKTGHGDRRHWRRTLLAAFRTRW
jgi:monoamine oxidase